MDRGLESKTRVHHILLLVPGLQKRVVSRISKLVWRRLCRLIPTFPSFSGGRPPRHSHQLRSSCFAFEPWLPMRRSPGFDLSDDELR